jgi:hypothetical protein
MALLIQNAVFNYVSIKTPKLEYEAKADPKGDHLNKEYVVDVLMPYASWKKFKKHYKKVGAIEKAKTYNAAEYEAAFKVAPPSADVYADEDGDFTVIKFRQRAYYKDSGDKTKQPRIVGVKNVKNGAGEVISSKDSEGQEVGLKIEVGNGSEGILQFKERTWTFGGKPGLSLDLVAIQVKKLVPYEGGDELDFDMEEDEVDTDANPFAGGDGIDDDADTGSEPQAPAADDEDW